MADSVVVGGGVVSPESGTSTTASIVLDTQPRDYSQESQHDSFAATHAPFVNEHGTLWGPQELGVHDSVQIIGSLPEFDLDDLDFAAATIHPQNFLSFMLPSQKSQLSSPDKISFHALPTSFSDKIEEACVTYISQMLGLPGNKGRVDFAVCLDSLKETYMEKVGMQCVSDLAAIAVYLLAVFAGIDSYIYGVTANEPMELVMRWRINPTLENRLAIPEPFRPTPLQFSTPKHPLAIDFVNWPSIRDQLILQANHCDLDRVIQDIVLNTVVEIPQHRVALNILDLYIHKVLPRDRSHDVSNSATLAPTWALSQYNTNLVGEALVHEVSWRMQNGVQGQSIVSEKSELLIPKFRKNALASKYGLDQLTQWKLSREFCDSHPYLDCASGEFLCSLRILTKDVLTNKAASSYPMVSCTSIPGL